MQTSRFDVETFAIDAVAHAAADDATPARFAQPLDELRVGQHHGAALGCVERVGGAEPRRVDAPFVEREGALDAPRQRGFESQRFGAREPRVRPPVLEGLVAVVHLEPDLDQLGSDRVLREDRHHERNAEDQMRRDALDRARVARTSAA